MDHESVPKPSKIYDWLLNLSRDHFGLHQGIHISVTMEFEVPNIHILRLTLSIDVVQRVLWWERQKRRFGRKGKGLWPRKCWYNDFLMIFLFEKWRQEKTREWSNMFFLSIYYLSFQNYPFWTCIKKKISTFVFGAWSFMLVHIQFTPSEGPKDFINLYFWRNRTVKVGSWRKPSSMVRLHGPWCKLALRASPPCCRKACSRKALEGIQACNQIF